VLDRTMNDRGRTSNNRLNLKLTRTFIIHLRNVRQMAKSIDPYTLHSSPISALLSYISQLHFFFMHLFYHNFFLKESSRVRRGSGVDNPPSFGLALIA